MDALDRASSGEEARGSGGPRPLYLSRTETLRPSIFAASHYCSVYEREIDVELVRVVRPECIEEMNGCGNCPHRRYVALRRVLE